MEFRAFDITGKSQFPKVVLSAIAPLLLLVGACDTNPADKVTIPPSDATAPTVVMDIFQPSKTSPLTVTPATQGTPTVTAGADEVITLTARGDDPDGGVQDIQIWVTKTLTQTSGGVQSVIGPGLVAAPEANNPDSGSVGGLALKSRLVTLNIDMKQIRAGYTNVRIDVKATAKNFNGGTVSTPSARIVWP
jgi:hypothetical protein